MRSPLVLPCPRRQSGPARPHVSIVSTPRQFTPAPRTPGNAKDWFRSRRLPDGSLYLRWSGLFEFLVSPDGARIQYRRLEHATRESFSTYLLSQVLSFSLIALGAEPLHGTVVVADGGAIAFLGDCGYGKSTLGAAFLARGFSLLTDDLVALDVARGTFRVHPGVPRIKLFPRISRAVLGSRAAGPRLNPETSKMVLPLAGRRTGREPVPLRAMYVLADPALRDEDIRLAPLSRSQAMVEIVRNTFNTIVDDRERLARQFRSAATLAHSVPVSRLHYPRELPALPDVCDAVLADVPR